MSLPAWECGLKSVVKGIEWARRSHSLRGSVDWNIDMLTMFDTVLVTPCVGVWIEIVRLEEHEKAVSGHSLRGSVDWNTNDDSSTSTS